MDSAAGVEVSLLGLNSDDGTTLLGAHHLSTHQIRKASGILGHKDYLTPTQRLLSSRISG